MIHKLKQGSFLGCLTYISLDGSIPKQWPGMYKTPVDIYNGMFLPYQLVIAGFLPSTVAPVFVWWLLLSPPEFFCHQEEWAQISTNKKVQAALLKPGDLGLGYKLTANWSTEGWKNKVGWKSEGEGWKNKVGWKKKGRGLKKWCAHITPRKLTNVRLKSQWVGRCMSYWNSPFWGDMLVFRGVPVSPIISREVLNNDSITWIIWRNIGVHLFGPSNHDLDDCWRKSKISKVVSTWNDGNTIYDIILCWGFRNTDDVVGWYL